MLKYGKVIFSEGGEKGAGLQKTLITRLADAGIIGVNEGDIEKWYEEDLMDPYGCEHTYVLHNKNEVRTFKETMQSEEMQDESVKWKVSMKEKDPKFQEWVREVEARRNGISP